MHVVDQEALGRARRKAYLRLLPLLFLCYVIAYVDRTNVSIAKLEMTKALPGFDNAVIGLGAGIFFLGYFLLEIPGALIVERWSARKWICRIMLTWGAMAALTALVTKPWHFYGVRFLLGLAEAGFFPGVIIYLTHWFPARDRTRALSYFLVATPLAQMISPKISNALLKIGTTETVNGVLVHHPQVLGMSGWQWVYVAWGVPAIVLGIVVLFMLTDRPRDAKWLTAEERDALEGEIENDRTKAAKGKRMTFGEALRNPRVVLLALAYFFCVSGTYGIEYFLPSILERWYSLKIDAITWLIILPPALALGGQLFVGWSSDRLRERRLHAVLPIMLGVAALVAATLSRGTLSLTIVCFMLAFTGMKSYQPAFWAMPSLFLTKSAAAGSIGLINSVGNLGGFLGPTVIGSVEKWTGSFEGGLYYLCVSMTISALILFFLGVGKREAAA
ncbi:MFS transporter [Humisphaera borealis]|uniref:MFS transporter n=2 Tax=Humisphaera borealis TaxID=2807512 RepID=A0A7M2X4E4_9BACT|nr:MFS transporter [Humisphaera borealis]